MHKYLVLALRIQNNIYLELAKRGRQKTIWYRIWNILLLKVVVHWRCAFNQLHFTTLFFIEITRFFSLLKKQTNQSHETVVTMDYIQHGGEHNSVWLPEADWHCSVLYKLGSCRRHLNLRAYRTRAMPECVRKSERGRKRETERRGRAKRDCCEIARGQLSCSVKYNNDLPWNG